MSGYIGGGSIRRSTEDFGARAWWKLAAEPAALYCEELPKHFFEDVVMNFQEIIAGTVGKENTFGTCYGRVKAGAMSYVRFSTDDYRGKIRG